MNNRALCFLLLTTISGGATAQDKAATKPDDTRVSPNRHEGVILEPHIQNTHVDERRKRRRTLNLFRPAKADGALPAIVMFYGGGWMNGRPGQLTALAQSLVQRGYVCICLLYTSPSPRD